MGFHVGGRLQLSPVLKFLIIFVSHVNLMKLHVHTIVFIMQLISNFEMRHNLVVRINRAKFSD